MDRFVDVRILGFKRDIRKAAGHTHVSTTTALDGQILGRWVFVVTKGWLALRKALELTTTLV